MPENVYDAQAQQATAEKVNVIRDPSWLWKGGYHGQPIPRETEGIMFVHVVLSATYMCTYYRLPLMSIL